jgi:hypothetical protein
LNSYGIGFVIGGGVFQVTLALFRIPGNIGYNTFERAIAKAGSSPALRARSE